MKILHAILGFYPQIGGAENQAKLLCNKLTKLNLSILVLTRKYKTDNEIQHNKFNIKRIWPSSGFASRELTGIASFFWLLFHFNKYDVYHVHQCNVLSYFVMLSGRVTSTPVIVKIANSGCKFDITTLKKRPFGSYMAKSIIKSECHFIALSLVIKNELICCGVSDQRVHIIPNGINVSLPIPSIKKNFVTFVGRLESVKQPELIINLALRRRDINFRIVGEGSLKSKLLKIIESKKISNVFVTSSSNMDEIYTSSSLIILPSVSEGMSNVLLESISYNLPILCSDLNVNKVIFQDKYNLVRFLDPDNIDEWHTAINELYSVNVNEEKPCYSLINYYNIENVAEQYKNLYQDLINQSRK
jgi:glycosyltransferase involved in cell wall biosynthesis